MHQVEAITGFAYLAPWLVFVPVLGLLINMIFGGWFMKRSWGEAAIGTIASVASGITFVISVLLAYTALGNHGEAIRWQLAEWIHVGTLDVNWTFRIDTLSTTMMLLVSGVGTLIHIYAIGYMHEDVRFKHQENRFARFFVFLNLFIAMMMILVSGDSYLMLFVGWEGVGLCSFLLIGFWFEMDTLAASFLGELERRQKGLYHQPCRRLWVPDRGLPDVLVYGQPAVRRGLRSSEGRPAWNYCSDLFLHAGGCDGQVGADSALRLAPGCDGRPDPGLGFDPCRDHGYGRRLPDRSLG